MASLSYSQFKERTPSTTMSIHADKREVERGLPEDIVLLRKTEFEPHLKYIFSEELKIKPKIDDSKGVEFLFKIEVKGTLYGLVGTYKQDNRSTKYSPIIIWMTVLPQKDKFFIKSGTIFEIFVRVTEGNTEKPTKPKEETKNPLKITNLTVKKTLDGKLYSFYYRILQLKPFQSVGETHV